MFFHIVFVVFIIGYGSVHSLTEAEMKIEFIKFVTKCMSEHPVPVAELHNLQKLIVPKDPAVKCLLACAYKLEGLMSSKGLYDIEHAYKLAEIAKNGDEKRYEMGKKMSDLCVKVNELPVSDGEKGCDRAGLIFKCGVDNAEKFGFKL